MLLAIAAIYFVYFLLLPLPGLSYLVQKISGNKFIFYKLDSWTVALFFRAILKFFSVKIIVEADHYQQTGLDYPIIYLSNHFSMFDIPILYQYGPNIIRMIARDEVFKFPLPFFSTVMQTFSFLPVNLTVRHTRKNKQTFERAKSMLYRGIPLWMAPEGGLSKTGKLMPFKNGAFKLATNTNAAIVPIAIINSDTILGQGNWSNLRPKFGVTVKLKLGKPILANKYNQDYLRLKQDTYTIISDMLEDNVNNE